MSFNNAKTIDLSSLKSGIYFVRIKTIYGSGIKKI